MYIPSDTICAAATVPGTGAISVIRVSGPETFSIVDKVVSLKKGTVAESKGYSLHRGTVLKDGEFLDDVLVSVFRAPLSYTGEDSVEISCHSSKYIVQQIIFQLISAGARSAGKGEFTRRAFASGKMDLAEAEAVADLIASENAAAHRLAANQLRGGFSAELQSMREQLVTLASLMELELDFSEEDVEFADRKELMRVLDTVSVHVKKLIGSFRLGNAIRNGVPVAIVGAVNSGKSTLLNALLGEDRAIVSDIAGTTRDTIEDTLNIDGTLFRFIDTAGIRETDELIEREGIERSFSKMKSADIVLCVLDMTSELCDIQDSIDAVLAALDLSEQKLLILANKLDISECNKKVQVVNNYVSSACAEAVMLEIAAKTGFGLEKLCDMLLEMQMERVSDSETTLVTNSRHYEALVLADTALDRLRSALASQLPTDLAAQDLREATYWLGSITGEITTDDLLGVIFERFCIGK